MSTIAAIVLVALLTAWAIGICIFGWTTVGLIWLGKEQWGLIALVGMLLAVWVLDVMPILVLIYIVLSQQTSNGGMYHA